MSSSSSGLCGESGGGGREIRHAEEDQLLVAEAGRRIEAAEPLEPLRHEADLLLALPPRRVFRRFALVQPARRQLPDLPIERRAVLPDDDHAAVVLDRDQHDRRRDAGRSRRRAPCRWETAVVRSRRRTRGLCRWCSSVSLHDRVEALAQLVEHALQVRRQRAQELHPPAVVGMREHEARRVQKRAIEMRDRAHVARHAPVDAAVQRVADDRDGRSR